MLMVVFWDVGGGYGGVTAKNGQRWVIVSFFSPDQPGQLSLSSQQLSLSFLPGQARQLLTSIKCKGKRATLPSCLNSLRKKRKAPHNG
jgi:hypothetical protein